MSTRPPGGGPSDDTLDAVLASALVVAVFTLLFLVGVWSAEAHTERMTTPTTPTATAER